MIGKKDLETDAGKAEFEESRKAAERFIKSKIFRQTDAEDLAQETGIRILQKLSDDENLKVNTGYFIQTARNVLLEYYRRQNVELTRFVGNPDDETETGKPLDADSQLKDFDEQKKKNILVECMLECLEQRTLEEQILLFRYSSANEKHPLDDDEPDSYKNFFASFLDSIRALRIKFLALQNEPPPLAMNAKVKISRLRRKLRECRLDCIARKKGFA